MPFLSFLLVVSVFNNNFFLMWCVVLTQYQMYLFVCLFLFFCLFFVKPIKMFYVSDC